MKGIHKSYSVADKSIPKSRKPEKQGVFLLALITTIRTRTGDGLDKITAYVSEDNGKTWIRLMDPVADAGRGGSPPALIKMEDGRLALVSCQLYSYG